MRDLCRLHTFSVIVAMMCRKPLQPLWLSSKTSVVLTVWSLTGFNPQPGVIICDKIISTHALRLTSQGDGQCCGLVQGLWSQALKFSF